MIPDGSRALRRRASAFVLVAGLAGARPGPARAAADAVEDVCVGKTHSCALARDGRVACWGDNAVHQVSAADVPQLDAPQWISDFPPASRLRCAPDATCVQTRTGTIQCQGLRYHDTTRVNRSDKLPDAYAQIALPRPARDFVATSGGGCAILDNRALWCWSSENPERPFPAPGVSDAVSFAVSAGNNQLACVTRAEREPACVRFGGRDPRNLRAGFPVEVQPLSQLADAKQLLLADSGESLRKAVPAGTSNLALSSGHACAIANGRVLCWGDATHGELGDGTRYQHGAESVPGIADATAIAAEGGSMCASRTSDRLTCWGRAPQGVELGKTGFADVVIRAPTADIGFGPQGAPCARFGKSWSCWDGARWRPSAAPGEKPDRAFGRGVRSVTDDGQCVLDRRGRLGCLLDPAAVPPAQRVSWVSGPFAEIASFGSVSFGHRLACARGDDGRVSCFRFGAPDDQKLAPVVSPALAGLADVVKLVAASVYAAAFDSDAQRGMACALTRAGGVACWRGSGADAPAVQTIEGLPPAADIAVGGNFGCAVTRDHRVFCWGNNGESGAPNGAPRRRPAPVEVRWPPP